MLTLRNLLSFGPEGVNLELRNLNVLVGPNGSGKSNLLEAIALLRSSATEFTRVFERGGGALEFVWKGHPDAVASLDAVFDLPKRKAPLRHVVAFRASAQRLELEEERIENDRPQPGERKPYFFYQLRDSRAVINKQTGRSTSRPLTPDSVDFSRSILAQRRDPDIYPELTSLASFYERIRLYREWTFGRDSILRTPRRQT